MHLNYLDCPKFVLNMAKKILNFQKRAYNKTLKIK